MSTDLVQISDAPPYRQSTEVLTACPILYVEVVKKKRRKPGGVESVRGTQVHETMARYSSYCAVNGVPMDLAAFDRFAEGAGPAAAKILVGLRDSYKVDYEHLFATEIMMNLDEEFNPTDVPNMIESECGDSGKPPAYQGTIDAILLFREARAIQIDDFKTHPRAYDPTDEDKSMQSKMYSIFCFMHFPWVMEVKFRLIFVRYKDLTREVVYTREDLPRLIESVKFARARQMSIHEMYDEGKLLQAMSGEHCLYCPKLSDRTCPIAEFNDQMQLTPEDWVRYDLWYSAYSKVNRKRMKERVTATGRGIVVTDYNGKAYVYGPVPSTSFTYPLFHGTPDSIAFRCMGCGNAVDHAVENGQCPKCKAHLTPIMPLVELFQSYADGNPADTKWMAGLTLSSTTLSPPLKAKSRAFLHQSVKDTADEHTSVSYKTSKPLDTIPEQDDDEEDFEEF